ncbi:nuclear transport factor 2 family protein [Panacibacter sp. DH6]|uniref:Nuclear transport factor 2 family protein n=1 Tax=Panacibacter microcysteis TaxID=2793269 RepID=A0A931E117_9BACT|nr:nuclear transport factor 2 family protein [Panacibacter microcysteis]MBG9375108.1 nuclear transport factor 2 family protein [Panacibacter microcysteis]
MKKLLLLFAVGICCLHAFGQSKDEQALAAATDTLVQAIIRADRAVLEKLTADQLSYGHSGGKVENRMQFIDAIVNGPFDFTDGNITGQTVSVNDKIGIVRHVFTFHYNNKGESGEMKLGILLVWQKQKNEWKLLARQAFKL